MTAGQHKGVPPLLRVTAGPTGGDRATFRFRLSFRIGRRDDCEVCIQDDYVSRDHAEMVFEDAAWWVRDLGSAIRMDVGGLPLAGAGEQVPPSGSGRIGRFPLRGTDGACS